MMEPAENEELDQLSVNGFTVEHQKKLLGAKVLIAGAGAVVRAVVMSLAASGVGTIKIVDTKIAALNALRGEPGLSDCTSDISFQLVESLIEGDLEKLVGSCDIVIDVLDDWQEKLNLSDLCMAARKPLLHCGGGGMRFQLFSMIPGKSCCLRCLLASLGLEDSIGGRNQQNTLPSLAGIVGNSLVLAAVKIITAFGASQSNELIKIDGLSGELEVMRGFDPVNDCPDCGIMRRKAK